MSAATHPTTSPRPSNSLLRRRQRRATANLLVRGSGRTSEVVAALAERPPVRRAETIRSVLTMGGQLLPTADGRSYQRKRGRLSSFAHLPARGGKRRKPRRRRAAKRVGKVSAAAGAA